MPLSSYEVAMQTMASVLSDYLEEKKGVPKITKDGLNQMVKEQFPHCEKEEISPGLYEIKIPLDETSPVYSPLNFQRIPIEPLEAFKVEKVFLRYEDDTIVIIFPMDPLKFAESFFE